jgi:hypothetical protein
MTLIDYASSDDEFIICAEIMQLNSMSLSFMMNESRITMNIFMIKSDMIKNVAAEILAQDHSSTNFMNISKDINDENNIINNFIILKTIESVHNVMKNMKNELMKRKNVLKEFSSKTTLNKSSTTHIRKRFETEIVEKAQSSRKNKEENVEMNDK